MTLSGCRPFAVSGEAERLPPRRAREGELPCNGKRSWPGPRPRRAIPGHDSARQTLRSPRRGAHCAPAYLHPAGASPSRKRQAHAKHRQHPRPRGQAQNRAAATLSQIKFFHRMWTNLFAVAGSCELPPAGVIRKRGRSAPSCAPVARSDTVPAREARVTPVRLVRVALPAAAQAANTQVSNMHMLYSR